MTERGTPTDDALVAAQIGRPTRARADVVARCSLGLPTVVRMPPVLPSGEPFPTRYWLTCPLAHRRIARLEAAGGVAELDERVRADAAFAGGLARAHERTQRERAGALPESAARVPTGGVGGSIASVKCLHAHFADFVGSRDNPVGADVAARVEPLVCDEPCVVPRADNSEIAVKSGAWREPPRVVEPPAKG